MASGSSLPTIWRVPDELWAILAAVLAEYDPPSRMGRPRIDQRKACDGIIYRLRTGCQWNVLPQEFGDDISVYRTFRRWESKESISKLFSAHAIRVRKTHGGGKAASEGIFRRVCPPRTLY